MAMFMQEAQFKEVWNRMNLDEKGMLALYMICGWEETVREHLLKMRKKYLGW